MNIISISDIHLCRGEADGFCFDKELSRFLRHVISHLSPFEIILNGDIFDLIAIEDEGDMAQILAEINKEHALVFDAFREVAKKGHLALVPGNHDYHLKDETISSIAGALIPGIEVITSGIYRTGDKSGNVYHFEHGDAHDPWSSLVSPQSNAPAKTNMIVKNLIQEFLRHPLKILTSSPGGAASEALQRVIKKIKLAEHERKLFEDRVVPLIRRFKVNPKTLWELAASLSARRLKKFGKIYMDMVGAEMATGEGPHYREAAGRIAKSMPGTALRVVGFGHTHKPEVADLEGGAIYANSGTWGRDISKDDEGEKFYEITKGTYLLFNQDTLRLRQLILNYFIPPTRRLVMK
ncbi:metallophosphoesterase [Candidatus Uhrbacteria bacterium]|nr:metallophosphoesterase [Candidatus Uhrbacteria bacterium]